MDLGVGDLGQAGSISQSVKEGPCVLAEQGPGSVALVCPGSSHKSSKLCASLHHTEACNLPIVRGPCRAFVQLWAFDAVQGKCVLFTYGGCQGNGNKFYSEKECKEYCGIPGDGRGLWGLPGSRWENPDGGWVLQS